MGLSSSKPSQKVGVGIFRTAPNRPGKRNQLQLQPNHQQQIEARRGSLSTGGSRLMEKYLPPPRSAKMISFPIRQAYLRIFYHDHTRNCLKQEQGLHFRRLHSKADGEPKGI